jgi:hypothetical protein
MYTFKKNFDFPHKVAGGQTRAVARRVKSMWPRRPIALNGIQSENTLRAQ